MNLCCETVLARDRRAFVSTGVIAEKMDADAISNAIKGQLGNFLKNLLPQ